MVSEDIKRYPAHEDEDRHENTGYADYFLHRGNRTCILVRNTDRKGTSAAIIVSRNYLLHGSNEWERSKFEIRKPNS